ncbi:MAG: cupredoxin domain-containing protein, partial [Candidatus Omnitrophica bacterium]|nr:cupredoxin domain-containing protein [Candidatus Omnitrophota bacterium]
RNKLPLLLFIIGSLFCATLSFAEERFFEIKAKKFSYTPNIIRVKIGDKVKIRLISEDVTHGIFVDGYGVETRAHPGQDGSLSFVANRPGRFTFRCSVTCGEFHPYMVGYLVVSPNLRFYLYATLVFIIGIGSILLLALKKGSVG